MTNTRAAFTQPTPSSAVSDALSSETSSGPGCGLPEMSQNEFAPTAVG